MGLMDQASTRCRLSTKLGFCIGYLVELGFKMITDISDPDYEVRRATHDRQTDPIVLYCINDAIASNVDIERTSTEKPEYFNSITVALPFIVLSCASQLCPPN